MTMEQATLLEIIESVELSNIIDNRPDEFKEILFPVKEISLYTKFDELKEKDVKVLDNPLELVSDYKALYNKNTGKQISVVTSKYHVVDNTSVLEHFETMLQSQQIRYEYGFATTARNGRKTIMELILPDMVIDLGNGDTQEMRLYIQNSFDGGNSVKLEMGFFRHLCSNMALMQGTAELQYKTSHIGNATDRIKTNFNFYITEKFKDANNFINKLQVINFENNETVIDFINEENNTVLSDRDRIKLLNLWNSSYKPEHGLSFWGLYNAYTHFITHNMKISQNGKMERLVKLSNIFNKEL